MGKGIVFGINYSLDCSNMELGQLEEGVTAGNIMLAVLWQQHQKCLVLPLHPRPVFFFFLAAEMECLQPQADTVHLMQQQHLWEQFIKQ